MSLTERRTPFPLFLCALAGVAALAGGCDGDKNNGGAAHGKQAEPAPAVTNRIDVPEKIRQNLGITFAKVERRRVKSTIRVPGRFELLPSARREYRAAVPGSVELLVRQYQRVEAGVPLYRMRSPEWPKLRQQLQDDQAAARRAAAEVAAAEAARAEAEQAAAILDQRIRQLAEAGTRRAELESEFAGRRASIPRLEAEAAAKRAEAEAAKQRFPLTLASAAALLRIPADELTKEVAAPESVGGGSVARWRTVEEIEVVAAEGGVVESFGVTNGSWAEQGGMLVSTVNPRALRFRASALQSDLGRIRDAAPATIVPPQRPGAAADDVVPIHGTVSLGLEASPDTRTVELIVTPEESGEERAAEAQWARAGVSAYAEIVTDDSEDPEPAIPLAAVVQDDLERIYFRRDPKNPDKVIRMEGDFGVSDGEWVVVQSGLKAGDEVVLAGVYELKLTGSGKAGGGAGGHFHADGTWHAGGTPEPGGK